MLNLGRISVVLAALAAGAFSLSAQTVWIHTDRTARVESVRCEGRRFAGRHSSGDFWKAERWSVRASVAMPSHTASTFAEGTWWGDNHRSYGRGVSLSDIYADYNGVTRSSGALCLGADYVFARWFALSADLSATVVWHDVCDGVSGHKTGTKSGVVLCLMPQAKFIYLNRPTVRLYGKLGLGVVKYFGFDRRNWDSVDGDVQFYDNSFTPGIQSAPFGIELGRKFFGFAEIGVGTLYRGISAGLGYKF